MKEAKSILFISPIATRSGYGEHAKDFAKYLFRSFTDSDIKLLSTKWGSCSLDGLEDGNRESDTIYKHITNSPPEELSDISFHMTMPNEFKRFGKYNVGITAGIEANKCSREFLIGCNQMDLVIVPSAFAKETLLNTQYENLKCNTPIEVVFEGYPHEISKTNLNTEVTDTLNNIKEDFCFLTVGQWVDSNDRKNIDTLIKSFYDTFENYPNPPALVLKVHGISHCIEDELRIHERVSKIRKDFPGTSLPNIYLLYGNLTQSELASMYSHEKIKCMISLTRGEGFGRPLLEASIHNIPIIASKWSGHLDFLNKKYTKLISGKLIKVENLKTLVPSDAMWFDVDVDLVKSTMLDLVDRYEVHVNRASKLAEVNRKKYTLEKMFEEYDKVFENYLLLESQPNFNLKTNIQ
jgi:glycosyltransferase involved in cell wall biosynthesis